MNKLIGLISICVMVFYATNTSAMDINWVYVNDPGVEGHEGFHGYMSKYETTNAQYCEFLNAALATGDITVGLDTYFNWMLVYGANGSNGGGDFVGQRYYNLDGPGLSNPSTGVINEGGAARINYSGGVFTVDSGFENHPVTHVSWYGATAFCNYYGYRLPTEWEWQAVADYEGSYTYGCGTDIDVSIANIKYSVHPDGTTVVGSFGTYGYGMCDMAGNVEEWTSSIWDPVYGSYILRGGYWEEHYDENYTVSYRERHSGAPGTFRAAGFRVVSASANTPPVADAGGPYLASVGQPIVLDGSGSYDEDGDLLSYLWSQADTLGEFAAASDQSPFYTASQTGITDLTLTVSDDQQNASNTAMLVVYDPSGGFVTGGGWIYSEAGNYVPDLSLEGKANFGFVSKYKKGTTEPTGQTEFVFEAGALNFHSNSYDWLVVTGSDYARFKGWGSINGEGGYRFMLWAGDNPDTFRIRIWTEDEDGVETDVYDNGMDQVITGGSIVIHAK